MTTRIRSAVSLVASSTVMAVLVSLLNASPAEAEDSIAVQLQGYTSPIVISTSGGVSMPATTGTNPVASQCTKLPEFGNLCIGTPTVAEQVPLTVGGLGNLFPLIKAGDKAETALGWIVEEGKEAIRIQYGVPDDERIGLFARSELRAYLFQRLMLILEKKANDESLTAQEQLALNFVNTELAADDALLATAAYQEHQAWENVECGYTPPAPPNSVFKPLELPEQVTTWCDSKPGVIAQGVEFAPPIPSVDHFTTWGAYRHAEDLGLDAYGSDVAARNAANTTAAILLFTGLAVAAAASAFTAVLAGSSLALATGFAAIAGSTAATIGIGGSVSSAGAATLALPAIGAGVAAGLVATIVIGVIITAISIWMVVERESIGTTLKKRMTDAVAETDPLDLDGSTTAYRSEDSVKKLLAKVIEWTTFAKNPVTGKTEAIEDPTGIWSDNAPTADDEKFLIQRDGQPPETVSQITVPMAGGATQTVHFSRGWMVITPQGGSPRPALSFGFVSHPEGPRKVFRAPSPLGGFISTDVQALGQPGGLHLDSITYDLPPTAGDLLTVSIVPPVRAALGGPRPSAVGPLLAGRPVILRPNPVNPDGSSIPLDEAENDSSYEWTVTRHDTSTNTWEPVTTSTAFGPSFTPTTVGDYHARVKMTSTANPSQVRFGYVEFTVSAPPITPVVLDLVDDGSYGLEVDVQVTEPIASDDLTIEVTWPRDMGATTAPTTQIDATCIQTDPLECTTPRTGTANSLTRTLTNDTDFRDPVTVTLRNSYGGTLTKQFSLDNPGRPTFAAPPAAPGSEGAVFTDAGIAQLELPLQNSSTSQTVATVVPGTGGGQGLFLVDSTFGAVPIPGTQSLLAALDDDKLVVEGTPRSSDLGTHEVPLLVQQSNGNLGRIVLVVHVVPATGNRFRAGLQTDIDPTNSTVAALPSVAPAVLGGRTEWASYDGQLCVKLQDTDEPIAPPPGQKCGPLADFFTTDGSARDFPWAELAPAGLGAGAWQLSAWLPSGDPNRVDVNPLTTSFRLSQDVTFPGEEPNQVVVPTPTITGKVRVGEKLTAAVGKTTPTGAALQYRWLRDGAPINGVVSRTYVLGPVDLNRRISVRVTGKLRGLEPGTATSAQTARVAPGVLAKTPVPRITGQAKVGKTLTAVPGSWGSGVSLGYAWYAGNTLVWGAKSKKLKVTKSLRGKQLRVSVTGVKKAYLPVIKISAPTSSVR